MFSDVLSTLAKSTDRRCQTSFGLRGARLVYEYTLLTTEMSQVAQPEAYTSDDVALLHLSKSPPVHSPRAIELRRRDRLRTIGRVLGQSDLVLRREQ